MEKDSWYAEAIVLLENEGLDYKHLVFQFAARFPKEFVEANSQDLVGRVKSLLKADYKIQAIKLVREEKGLSLKEAKEWVEKFEEKKDVE